VLTTADSISTFRFVVKNVAIRNGLHATFMPKTDLRHQRIGHAHAHVAVLGGTNIFYDASSGS
jgi:glutamine synthetase